VHWAGSRLVTTAWCTARHQIDFWRAVTTFGRTVPKTVREANDRSNLPRHHWIPLKSLDRAHQARICRSAQSSSGVPRSPSPGRTNGFGRWCAGMSGRVPDELSVVSWADLLPEQPDRLGSSPRSVLCIQEGTNSPSRCERAAFRWDERSVSCSRTNADSSEWSAGNGSRVSWWVCDRESRERSECYQVEDSSSVTRMSPAFGLTSDLLALASRSTPAPLAGPIVLSRGATGVGNFCGALRV